MAKFVGKDPPPELVQSTGWSFVEASHTGGFLGYGNSSAKAFASFELSKAGEMGILDIGYLLSYEGMGAVKLSVEWEAMGADHTEMVIDGLWGSAASITGYKLISIPEGATTTRVTFENLSANTETLYSSQLFNNNAHLKDGVRGSRKFKIASLQCC